MKPSVFSTAVVLACALVSLAGAHAVYAQGLPPAASFPSKLIRIVTAATGSGDQPLGLSAAWQVNATLFGESASRIVVSVSGAKLEAVLAAADQGFAAHLDEVPVLLVIFADLAALAAVDRDLNRYSFAGGASVYPFTWSILLAARAEGLGGVLTTMLIREEAEVKGLLGAPDHWALAGAIALGHPQCPARRLRRRPVAAFASVDRVDGPPLPIGAIAGAENPR